MIITSKQNKKQKKNHTIKNKILKILKKIIKVYGIKYKTVSYQQHVDIFSDCLDQFHLSKKTNINHINVGNTIIMVQQ